MIHLNEDYALTKVSDRADIWILYYKPCNNSRLISKFALEQRLNYTYLYYCESCDHRHTIPDAIVKRFNFIVGSQ